MLKTLNICNIYLTLSPLDPPLIKSICLILFSWKDVSRTYFIIYLSIIYGTVMPLTYKGGQLAY